MKGTLPFYGFVYTDGFMVEIVEEQICAQPRQPVSLTKTVCLNDFTVFMVKILNNPRNVFLNGSFITKDFDVKL